MQSQVSTVCVIKLYQISTGSAKRRELWCCPNERRHILLINQFRTLCIDCCLSFVQPGTVLGWTQHLILQKNLVKPNAFSILPDSQYRHFQMQDRLLEWITEGSFWMPHDLFHSHCCKQSIFNRLRSLLFKKWIVFLEF